MKCNKKNRKVIRKFKFSNLICMDDTDKKNAAFDSTIYKNCEIKMYEMLIIFCNTLHE